MIGCTPSVWSSGPDMNTARCMLGAWGTQNSAVAVGAQAADHDQLTEEYNGLTWANGGNTINARTGPFAFGANQNTGIIATGDTTPVAPTAHTDTTEEYNGTTWSNLSEAADLTDDMNGGGALGTVNSGLIWGSRSGGTYNSRWNDIKQWNGSTFSELSTPAGHCIFMHHQRQDIVGAGTQNSAILMGSFGACGGRLSELWDGTTFTSVAGRSSGTKAEGTAGGGGRSQNSSYLAGGNAIASPSAATTCTEEWDGLTWSNRNALIQARSRGGNGDLGTTSAGLVFGGCSSPTVRGYTEEYTSNNETTGSFGLIKARGGTITTDAFHVERPQTGSLALSSLFQLPVFSDKDLNYSSYEDQYQTGSISGSVDRVADVIVGQKLGEMWFDSDKNAIGYTYQSTSLYSQSLSQGTFSFSTASGHYFTSSVGFFTQSFYSHSIVTCYLTGSQLN